MSYKGFLQAAMDDPIAQYYLQAPVVLRNLSEETGNVEETWSPGLVQQLRCDCDQGLNRERLRLIQDAGRFGHWSRSQRFVGPTDSLSPEGLYPFPVSHPYDEYA